MAPSDPAAPHRATRRRRLIPVLGCLMGAAVVLGLSTGSDAVASEGIATQAEPTEDQLLARGQNLYDTSCVSCHGVDGAGLDAPNGDLRGPSIQQAGEAGAYFQLTTGRMPLADPSRPPEAKEPAFSPDEIDALVAYVATLGEGPALPDIDLSGADRPTGGVLYREKCQACHSATGAGGALSYGRAAPSLSTVTPLQIGGAVRSGPGQMPRFGDDIISEQELDDIADYVIYLQEPDDAGGLSLGRLGPIPEGMMAWIGGLGTLLVALTFMGHRRLTAIRVNPIPPGEHVDDDDPDTPQEAGP
ncbi:MAG: cytochrome bc1 complex diheme cytochrome c subunit [Iamia sp.]